MGKARDIQRWSLDSRGGTEAGLLASAPPWLSSLGSRFIHGRKREMLVDWRGRGSADRGVQTGGIRVL